MATELGKAYVQIMPSAKGISGSIQKTLNPESKSAGKVAGKNIASEISNSLSKTGENLTKYITAPAMAAATAVSGIVASLGWGRLTGLDSARAKLQGLGYDAKSVDRITKLVSDSIQGTVTTMAEGVSIAAGGLAAGVKEGAELERYIKLVGDAAVGAGRDVGDMAMIFNRVQGSGKLMTQELNMIEDGMPGFAIAMSKSLGVSQEEFRKMVTEGKVSSEQFLDVMEDFAGEMSEAYANSWEGIVSRTKSNIGILGEIMLGGVFEQSKEALAEFLEFIRTDDVREWFADAGQVIGGTLTEAIDSIKNAINWWINLDDETKELITKIVEIAVVAGPVLLAVSKLIKIGIGAFKVFGLIKGAAGILASAIGAISWPVVAVVAAIAGLIAVFVGLYNENERFREIVNAVWEEIKNVVMTVVESVSDFVMGIVGGLVDWWQENQELILESARVVWETIKNTIMAVLEFMLPMIQTAWEGIKNNIAAAWDLITTIVETGINFVKGIIKAVMQMITGDWSGAWETIKSTVSNLISGIKDIISRQLELAFTIVKGILNNIKAKFKAIFDAVWSVVGDTFKNVVNSVKDGMTNAYNAVKNFFRKFKDAGKNIVTSIADGIKGAISKVTDAISGVVGKVRDFLPFSPAKVGPLKDLDKLNFGGTISMGIDDGANEVQKAMEDMLTMPFKPTVHNPILSNDQSNAYATEQNRPIILQVDGKTFAQIIGDYTSAEGGNRIRRIERGLA